eukprot:NODE_2298_length_1154_cov_24.383710_g1906_i0.p1 GENE.NODE_2298_length_1154_cov_24.383710_g1906_i0~~NODE_2298_length_1154_cov_24.383710_g1906_i0.p1  ORF type:complete len:234 (+),score=43.30 NODE_2298_length_1154_cov_24.383710_g1906_i0:290-991(+)
MSLRVAALLLLPLLVASQYWYGSSYGYGGYYYPNQYSYSYPVSVTTSTSYTYATQYYTKAYMTPYVASYAYTYPTNVYYWGVWRGSSIMKVSFMVNKSDTTISANEIADRFYTRLTEDIAKVAAGGIPASNFSQMFNVLSVYRNTEPDANEALDKEIRSAQKPQETKPARGFPVTPILAAVLGLVAFTAIVVVSALLMVRYLQGRAEKNHAVAAGSAYDPASKVPYKALALDD